MNPGDMYLYKSNADVFCDVGPWFEKFLKSDGTWAVKNVRANDISTGMTFVVLSRFNVDADKDRNATIVCVMRSDGVVSHHELYTDEGWWPFEMIRSAGP